MDKEIKIPKAYVFTVEGIEKRFSVPSLSRDINDEFDADTIVQSAALSVMLDDEKYRDPNEWPLIFKFNATDRIVEMKVELHYSPSFLVKPNSTITTIEEKPKPKPRAKRVKKDGN